MWETIGGVHFSDGFRVPYLERFNRCVAIKIVSGNSEQSATELLYLQLLKTSAIFPQKALPNRRCIWWSNFSVQVKSLAILYDYFWFKFELSKLAT